MQTCVFEIVIQKSEIAQAAAVPVEPSHDVLAVSLAMMGEMGVAHRDGIALDKTLSDGRPLAGDVNALG